MSLRLFLTTCCAIVGLAAIVVVIELRKTNELRRQYSTVVEERGKIESRHLRHETLGREQPTSENKEALQQEIEQLHELRSTRDALRTQIEQSLKKTLARRAASRPERESLPWGNQGSATPVSTVETVFWSMAQGDVDTLATLIAFDDDARDQAERLYDVLPPDLRQEYDSPERLVAALMAIEKTVTSLKNVNVLNVTSTGPDRESLQLAAPNNGRISLNFHREGDGWKLLVPALVVDGFRHYAIGTLSLSEPMPDL